MQTRVSEVKYASSDSQAVLAVAGACSSSSAAPAGGAADVRRLRRLAARAWQPLSFEIPAASWARFLRKSERSLQCLRGLHTGKGYSAGRIRASRRCLDLQRLRVSCRCGGAPVPSPHRRRLCSSAQSSSCGSSTRRSMRRSRRRRRPRPGWGCGLRAGAWHVLRWFIGSWAGWVLGRLVGWLAGVWVGGRMGAHVFIRPVG